jgi:protein-tyrosine phosphatase
MTVTRAVAGRPQEWDRAFATLASAAPAAVALHRGAEMMLDRPLTEAAADRCFTLNGTRYLLVEFNRLVADSSAQNALSQAARLGIVPVLAHPERYTSCTPEAVQRWKAASGALMQVDATTLMQPRSRGDRARRLLAAGLVDILAADNHGDARSMATAREALQEHHAAVAEMLLVHNPAAILADGATESVPAVKLKESLLNRIKTLFDQDG